MTRCIAFVFALIFQAACGLSEPEDSAPRHQDPSGEAGRLVLIDVVPEIVSKGEPFEIRVENRSNRAIGYNLCFRTLERRFFGRWSEVRDSRICPAFLAILLPRGTVTGGSVVGAETPDGVYRLVFEMSIFPENDLSGDVPLDRRDRTSDAFVVD